MDYYTMESVRDLIQGKNYEVRSDIEKVPLPSWNRYPSCPVLKICRQIGCIGSVSIFVNTEKTKWINLEIKFFREKQRAFIRVGCLQMQKLFELKIINDESLLCKETF